MFDQFKNFMIGLFSVAAALIIVFMLMFLHPRIGDEGKVIHVRFTDIDKVTPGTRVTYAGKPVGEVVAIEEAEEGRSGPTDSQGRVYSYILILKVDSGVKVFNTDEISLRTSGLLGERNVDIMPYAPKKGELLKEVDHEILYAKETGSIDEAFKQFRETAARLDQGLDMINSLLRDVQEEHIVQKVSATIDRAHQAIDNAAQFTAVLNQPKLWKETFDNIHNFTERLHLSWTTVDRSLLNISRASANADLFMQDLKMAGAALVEGKGTLGQLFMNDDFYLRSTSIMSKLETTLDDINHYGLLFHSDKGWQRLRARRLNLLQQLRTPQEFRNYFNDEVDQISTSLSRVYMVMNELGQDSACGHLVQDREFSKVFAELMRRVTMLEEEVRLYNTQLVEERVHETELGGTPLCPMAPQ